MQHKLWPIAVFGLLFPLKSNNAFSLYWFLGFVDTRKLEEVEEEAGKEAELEKKEEVKAEDEQMSKPAAEGKLCRH